VSLRGVNGDCMRCVKLVVPRCREYRVPIAVVVYCGFTIFCDRSSRMQALKSIKARCFSCESSMPVFERRSLQRSQQVTVSCQWERWCVRGMGDIMLICSSTPSL
jgi:hypothetical protein